MNIDGSFSVKYSEYYIQLGSKKKKNTGENYYAIFVVE